MRFGCGRLESNRDFFIANQNSSKVNPILALSVLCGAEWFFVDAFILPPNFGGTDIYYFKDAGINFAQGLGFVTRVTFGNPTFEYQAYSQYPPLYPLLFGVFVELFGISTLTNQVFNSLAPRAIWQAQRRIGKIQTEIR
jgi:hypothetical protein